MQTSHTKLPMRRTNSPSLKWGTTMAPMRKSHTYLPIRRMPHIPINDPLSLTTYRCTQHRTNAAVPVVVTGAEDPWDPMPRSHNKLPIPWTKSPSLERRIRTPR